MSGGMFHAEARMARLASYRPRPYWLGTIGWIAWFVSPIGPGWLTGQLFDELQSDGVTDRFWWLLIGLGATGVGAVLLLYRAHRTYVKGVESAKGLLRVNVVHSQLASGGTEAAPRVVPVGDVLARMRDDPFDVLFLIDNWADFVGSLLFATGAVILLARIDPFATAAGLIPMFAFGFANRLVGNLARTVRDRARRTTSDVGHFLTATFEASLTVKLAGARPDVLRRFRELCRLRSHAAVRDTTWNELIWSLNLTAGDLFLGLALVVAARRPLSAGDIALFASYFAGLTWVPTRIGNILVGRRRYDVSAARLDELVAPRTPDGTDHLTTHRRLPILGGPPADPPSQPPRSTLDRLDVEGLTIDARGVRDVSFTVRRGTLTVLRGPVGSGKTSVLRAVIGLLDIDAGTVRWNGEPVLDRAAFFVPPQCAYVPQVPRLLAQTLRDNLTLGHAANDDSLTDAIRLAAFTSDVDEMPDGWATLVGARGVRLSGGQAQRAAAARALVHRPELLVLDDLTSALDAETEEELWTGLAAAGYTVLAASNRSVAIAHADAVIDL